ncbi:hypothetical protein C3V37_06070 [Peptostreptococcaceae bacterium oral taxon 929]|nr:hypothetical protein C3V37_06070 [Peptostreptococcaceae bacterium oral taxon 929]
MKKKISLLLAILMLVTLIPTAFAESKTVDAVKNTKKVTLDGEEVMVGAYDVEGYNYLKLRDVAAILNTKKCQFNVGFDKPTKLITVELAKGYEKVEGDLAEIKDEKAKAIVSVRKILVNGEEKEIKTALINEYNYMRLRDLGALVGLGVKYDAKNKVIMLKSDVEAKEEAPRYVMIKSKLYKDTGEINKNMKCGTMDGKILTSVDAKEMPKKDNESNFGTGYEYQIGTDGSITVEIDDKCLIFKEVKEEEKKDDKKDDKKEEKVELVPDSEWTQKEKDFFKTYESISEFITKALNYDSKAVSDETLRGILEYYQKLHETSLIQGRELFNGSPLKINTSVEKRADGRYAVIKFTYTSGGIYKAEKKDADSEKSEIKDDFENVLILELEDEAKEKYTDNKVIYAKLIEFHQAIVDNNLDEAVKILQSIGVKANAENVKEYIETRKQTAKNLGAEIFTKDFEYEKEYKQEKDDDGNDIIAIFNYKDGGMLFIGYSKTVGGVNGLGFKLK